MTRRPKNFDWESIEREFRAGQLSLGEIGKTYDISRRWIMKRATEKGWERNLGPKVHQQFKQEVLRIDALPIGAEDTPPPQSLSEEEIVEGAAHRKTEVLKCHRRDVASLRRTTTRLNAELDNPREPISLIHRSVINMNLANALHKLIALERIAFSMDDPRDNGASGAMPVTDGLISELTALRRRVEETDMPPAQDDYKGDGHPA